MKERKLSSRKLAAALGIHPDTVNNVIHARRTSHRSTVFAICTYLGLDLDDGGTEAA